MSSLEDYVNQQSAKSTFASSFSSLGDLRSKISSSMSGIPLLSRSATVDVDGSESLTDTPSTSGGQLPSSRNRKTTGWLGSITDEGVCGLSRTQRVVAFFMALMAAMMCFGMAVVLLPVLVLKARKFALLNTLGSVMLMLSFGFLWGPMSYLRHMASPDRRYVTGAYLSTVFATLWTSLWLQSTILTIIFATVQALALIWYVMSYAPGGERGLRFIAGLFGGMLKAKSKTVLPI